MANKDATELIIELDYLFDTKKDVFLPFRTIGTFYSLLHDLDKHILLNIHADLKVEYILTNVEYGSLKTKIAQILKSVPGELLRKPDIEYLIGILLIRSKHWILEKLSKPATIESKEDIEILARKINKEIQLIGREAGMMTSDVSPHFVLNSLDEISQETNKLPRRESYLFKSKFGNAILQSGISLNKAKILTELGQKTETTRTTEVIKPKKVDLLGESKWECILDGKSREMKVEDKTWLEKYHRREIDIQSGDSLRVELKTTYSYSPSSKIKVAFDIVRILDVITPDDGSQLTL